MIIVNLKRSYAGIIEDFDLLYATAEAQEARIREITVGDWPKLSAAALEGYDDMLVGTYEDMIVSAYRILGVETVETDSGAEKQRFIVADADDDSAGVPASQLIGCPVPGGPWKRGEGRGTRRYAMADYLEDNPGLLDRPEYAEAESPVIKMYLYMTGEGTASYESFPGLAAHIARNKSYVPSKGGVTVERQPGGAVVITIPTGTRATVNIDPEASM